MLHCLVPLRLLVLLPSTLDQVLPFAIERLSQADALHNAIVRIVRRCVCNALQYGISACLDAEGCASSRNEEW